MTKIDTPTYIYAKIFAVSIKESIFSGKLHLSGLPGRDKSAIACIHMDGLEKARQQLSEGAKFASDFTGTPGSEGGLKVAAQGMPAVIAVIELCNQCPVNYNTVGSNLPRTWGCNSLMSFESGLVTGSESLMPEEWLQKLQNAGAKCGNYLKLEREEGKANEEPAKPLSWWRKRWVKIR